MFFRYPLRAWGHLLRHALASRLVGDDYTILSCREVEILRHVYSMPPERFRRHAQERDTLAASSEGRLEKFLRERSTDR